MNVGKKATSDVWGLTSAYLDFRWLELTMLQHVLGGVIALTWLKLFRGKSLHPETNVLKLDILFASLGNALGNLATNAAYSFVSSSSVQILKGIEPLVTFVLAIFLYRSGGVFTIEILVSILMICVGASSFVVWDSTFNIWGIVAVLTSDIAFPVRNIFLKRVSWESPLQKYTVLSLLSALFILPALLVKLLIIQAFSLRNIEFGTTSALFHFIYNFVSISVLENVTPLTHSILNLSKRMFVVILNIIYFSTPLSKTMVFGLLTFFIGIAAFQMSNKNNSTHRLRLKITENRFVKILIGLVIALCVLFAGALLAMHNKNKHTRYASMSTAWVYNYPIPQDVVGNVESFLDHGDSLNVYCGTTQCINAFQPLSRKKSVSIHFLDISRIVKETPFESWFARQVYHKILTGRSFERHLHEVVKVSLLWHYGGLYFNPTLQILKDQYLPANKYAWTSFGTGDFNGNIRNPLDISFFPRGHPVLTKLATDFVNNYPSEGSDDLSNWPVEYNYRKVLMDSLAESCQTNTVCINKYTILAHVLDADLAKNSKCHFGTFSYDTRVAHAGTGNLGDEVQSFPGIQFLPYIDTFLDREELVSPFRDYPTVVFFNAWWGDSRMNFPPPEDIDPILLGMHFTSGVRDRSNILDFVKHSKFIGSRDMDTYNWLRSIGVETFFSSCLTLLTNSPAVNRENPKYIYLVDVKEEFQELIPAEVKENAISLEQDAPTETLQFRFKRIKSAFGMIEAYSQAKLVITQRIHCALPSAGMGIPVIFINSNEMPGGGGTTTASSARTVGLTDYFHTVDTYSFSKEKTANFFRNFDYSSPPPNPNVNLLMRDRTVNWNVIRQRQPLYDAAKKFGLLPFSSLSVQDNEFVFHFVFTSSRNSFIFDPSSHSLINLRNRRSIESVLYHHPLSRVLIHTNTLDQTDFEVYIESGYRVEVLSYELDELLKKSPIEKEIDTNLILGMKKMDDGPNFESYLVQLLVLYQSGGVFLSTDTFLLWPIEDKSMNSFSFVEDNKADFVTFMKFEKKHSIIEYLLNDFVKRYSFEKFDLMESQKLWEEWSSENANKNIGKVQVLKSADVFNCHIELEGKAIGDYLQQYSILTVENKSTDQFVNTTTQCSSIWEWINRKQCVLCDEIY